MGQLAHFISQALSRSHNSSALSLKERAFPSLKERAFPLSQGERGMGQDVHFVSIPFPLSQEERGMGQDVHFVSRLALRVTAGGRNP